VFGWILETGEALVLPDLTAQHLSDLSTSSVQDVVRGLVAVPIVGADQEIVGTICVFDLKPLTFGDDVVEALKALGRQGLRRPIADQGSQATRPAQAAVEPLARPADDVGERPLVDPAAAPLDRRDGTLMIARELARMRREQRPVSVIAFDVSPIGHTTEPGPTGSMPEVVGAVGETLARGIRASDLAVRWSGDELLLVLPGLGATEARQVAERVRAAMQAGAGRRVAVSGGVAELHPDESFESMVARANEKVQLARERGHNRVA
jgi:diguanylate cyclase (GGDEF)-like protein